MNEFLKMAHDGKYSDFAEIIKNEMKLRLSQRPEVQEYVQEINQIHKNKDLFSQIRSGG